MKSAAIAILCTSFGVWFGMVTEDLHRAEQRAADIRIMKANVDRCSIRWRRK